MFMTIFITKFKVNVRNKDLFFWMLAFPIILATLFHFGFSNMLKGESFETIHIAVVNNDYYQKDKVFQEFIYKLENEKANADSTQNFLKVSCISEEEATTLLKEEKISGYVVLEPNIKLVSKETGYQQTIMKSMLDEYQKTTHDIQTIIKNEPNALANEVLEAVSEKNSYIHNQMEQNESSNLSVIYFYTIIGMICMYACFLGVSEVSSTQANLSTLACRNAIAPTGKFSKFIAGICACICVQILVVSIIYAYMIGILKVDFGNQIGWMIVISVLGSLCGLFFGTVIGALLKKKENSKTAICISIIMAFSVLSGMMGVNVKYLVDTHIPVLQYINPVRLITDSLYTLYYYETHTRLCINLTCLSIISLILMIATVVLLRRKKYASL